MKLHGWFLLSVLAIVLVSCETTTSGSSSGSLARCNLASTDFSPESTQYMISSGICLQINYALPNGSQAKCLGDGSHIPPEEYPIYADMSKTTYLFSLVAEPYRSGPNPPGVSPCRIGSKPGENVNYLYCKAKRIERSPQRLSSDGTIESNAKTEVYDLDVVLSLDNVLDHHGGDYVQPVHVISMQCKE